eukprot:4773739-Lingulodinium_polyedra.AAC.1
MLGQSGPAAATRERNPSSPQRAPPTGSRLPRPHGPSPPEPRPPRRSPRKPRVCRPIVCSPPTPPK